MEMKLVDGDYVPDSGGSGFETVSDCEETLARVLYKLTARRGAFPFFPTLGSRMWMLCREKRSSRQSAARQYAAEALSDEDGIRIEDVTVTEKNDGLTVHAEIGYEGATYALTLEV